MTQYFDMLKEVGARSNTIMLPHSPGGMTSISQQIIEAITATRNAPPATNGGSPPQSAIGAAGAIPSR
jgi:hypothetical protein